MDLPANSPYRDDILEMEKAALRCKDIIQNLLGFSRTSTIEGAQILDLRRVLSKTVNILNLQFKSRGNQIEFKEPAEPILVEGQHNLLAQAFLSLIQGVFLRGQSGLPSLQIQIKLGDLAEVLILDTGPGRPEGADFQLPNLSVSQQILKDHKAILYLDRSNQASPYIKVSFSMKAERA
jgi:phosphoglycerate-specific signal transduction histidine kinase